MNTDRTNKATRLLFCLGDINDYFLEEAETADLASIIASSHKRFVRYSKLAAAASFGLAVTYWLFRARRTATGTTRKSA